jgi:hypothetical protein
MLATDQFLESHGISTVFDQDVQFGNTFMGANTTFPDGSVINIPPRSLDLDFLAASDAVIGFLTTSVLTSDLLYVGTEQAKLIQTTNLAANSVTSNNLAGNNLGALKAVLGDVSGGTIAGVTITGGTIRTTHSPHRIWLHRLRDRSREPTSPRLQHHDRCPLRQRRHSRQRSHL